MTVCWKIFYSLGIGILAAIATTVAGDATKILGNIASLGVMVITTWLVIRLSGDSVEGSKR